jgi:2-succinyl-5-enolpyruvyl-6-hydroxy-3-cyclohexene-1-carboxylate synthase
LNTAQLNLLWAHTLLDGLCAAGVRQVVLSPGARSTPLALAALRYPQLTARVVLDERSAAFLALGLAKGCDQPVAVIATSGSAIANWHPAVIEADQGRVPLILLSADRPPELQACGANQTIDQTRLFGTAVRAYHALPPAEPEMGWLRSLALRVVGEALGPLPGPVHVNLPFREPLVPGSAGILPALVAAAEQPLRARHPRSQVTEEEIADLIALISGRPGMIVCGTEDLSAAAPAITGLAWAVGAPILADPLSGLRTEEAVMTVVTTYDALLRHPDAPRPEWILRLGGEPVSKFLGRFLARHAEVPQVVVSGHPRWSDPHHTARSVVLADPGLLCAALAERVTLTDPGWLAHWQVMDQLARPPLDRLPEEGRLVRALAEDLPCDATLVAGNSLSVRQFDWFMGLARPGVRVMGNRGASGIDGVVSTVLGIAAVRPNTVAVIGDLTFLHDLNGLHAAPGIDGVLVVVNNGGGGIFDHLPQAGLEEFVTGWLTPPAVEIGRAAALFGLRHARTDDGETAAALVLEALAHPGLDVIELTVDRAASLAAHRAWFQAVENLEVLSVA